jgi:hypothetical protein
LGKSELCKFYCRRHTLTNRRQLIIFAQATLSTLLDTGLPRQMYHVFQAQTLIIYRFSGIEVFAAAGHGGKKVCVRLRLSRERSEKAAN